MANRVTSRGVLWEVIAPVVRWPLHSPGRLLLVTVSIVTAVCLLGELGRAVGGGEEPPSAASTSTSSSSTSSSSSSPSPDSTSPSPSSTQPRSDAHGHGQSEEELRAEAKRAEPAVKVATKLGRDLERYRSARSKAAWWKKIEPSLSTNGKTQLRRLSPKKVGFTKVTGTPRLVVTDTDMGSRYVNVGVPTDKGTYLFLVERSGKSWGVASISSLQSSATQGA